MGSRCRSVCKARNADQVNESVVCVVCVSSGDGPGSGGCPSGFADEGTEALLPGGGRLGRSGIAGSRV